MASKSDLTRFTGDIKYPLPGRKATAVKLGKGGNGFVFSIFHNGKEYAVKKTVYRANEIRVHSQLAHVNLVNLEAVLIGEEHDHHKDKFYTFYFMNKLDMNFRSVILTKEHGSLKHLKLQLSEQRNVWEVVMVNVKYVLRSVLRALDYMHSQGLVHRDVKASNILLKMKCQCTKPLMCACPQKYAVKLGDFDSSTTVPSHGLNIEPHQLIRYASVLPLGTMGYRAPEVSMHLVISGPYEVLYTTAVDIWSFDCLLMNIMIGKCGPLKQRGEAWDQPYSEDIIKETQDINLYDLIHKSLELKRKYNAEYLKRIAAHLPSELTESHSQVTAGNPPETENEETQKKINNIYKRINELESVDEAALLDDTDDKKEEPELKLTDKQLKMQRDMLRTELAKSLEHKKKTDQYNMEAKQYAQRLTAENVQLKESLKRVTSEKEWHRYHQERCVESSSTEQAINLGRENLMMDSNSAKGRKLNYEELENRMKFKLPPQWDGPVDYQSMAEAGFVYTGQEDLVYCFSCNVKLDRWSKDTEPLLRHKEESPTCSFMKQKLQAVKKGKTKSVVTPSKPLNSRLTSSIGELQSFSLITSKAIYAVVAGLNEPRLSYGGSVDDRPGAFLPITPENCQSEAERIKSFVGWPLNETVHPEQLARAGFVYIGDGALVQCFQCGVKYRHWYKGDVPLNVHQKCNPRCPFLQTLTSKSKSSLPEHQPTRSYIQTESIGSNTQGEEVSKHSLHFPDYSEQAVRLQSFKHWGGVLPAQELAEGGFYMIARRDVVRCLSLGMVLQEWGVRVIHHPFIYSDVGYITKDKECSVNFVNKVPVNNDIEQIQQMQHSPDWWSNPPWASSQDNSDKQFHFTESQQKNDNTMTLLPPSKIKIMVWLSLSLSIFVSPFKLPPQWEGPVSMTGSGFVIIGQEDLVCHNIIKVDRWSEPLLRHKEETSTHHELQAIEGGKVVVPSKPLEASEEQLSYEGNSSCGVSVLVVGNGCKREGEQDNKLCKITSSVNLPVQAQHGEFSTRHPLPQPSTEEAQVVPLPHFMNVTGRSRILSFPDCTAIDYGQQSQFPNDPNFEDKGVICPPDFDVPAPSPSDVQTPSVPIQSSEAVDHSAVLINQPMKTSFVDRDLADVHESPEIGDVNLQSPETSDGLPSVVKRQDGQLVEGDKPEMECKICYQHRVKYVFIPCGHATCELCTREIRSYTPLLCPYCRQPMVEILVAVELD